MRKRWLSLMLALCMVLSLIPTLGPNVEAATSTSYPPYPKIEYNYSSEVTCGTIRYIAQNRSSNYYYSSYWPSSSFGGYGSPESECGTACISMALSYVGVNRTPKMLLESTDGYTGQMWGRQGDATSSSVGISTSAISAAMDNYINGNGKYSPVCVYIQPWSASSTQHWILLIGRIDNNKYLGLNPWHSGGANATFTIQVNGSTATYNGTTNPITSVNQWYNPNGSIVPPGPPTDPSVTTNRSVYTLGDAVTITPSANGADHYTMRVCYGYSFDGEIVYKDFNGFNGSKTFTPTKSGRYSVWISAIAANGEFSGANCTFEVVDMPSNLAVTTDKPVYRLGEPVTITPSGDGVDHYTMRVCYGSFDGEIVYKDFDGFNGSKTIIPEKPGEYCVVISGINRAWAFGGASCKFIVTSTGGTRITFDPNGGSFTDTERTLGIDGINTYRDEHQLIVYIGDGKTVETNEWGIEVAVDSKGQVIAKRLYEEAEQLSIPNGGFVLSVQGGRSSQATAFVADIIIGDYVSYSAEEMAAYHYANYDEYLSEQKSVSEGAVYGDLPEPTKEGFYFKGWYLSNEASYPVNYLTKCTGTHLIAKWDSTPTAVSTADHNNHKYELYDYHMSWSEAKAFCEERGGHLVTITDAAEADVVLELAKAGAFCTYYLGCTDAETEGTWEWITGEPFTYSSWDIDTHEPNGGPEENIGQMVAVDNGSSKQPGEWNDMADAPNADPYGFYGYLNGGIICEYDSIACDHTYSYDVAKEPTTDSAGTLTGTCSSCGETTTISLPKLSTTDYNYSIIKTATCTSIGAGRYTWKNTSYGTFCFDVTIPMTEHSYQHAVTAPTCTEQGYTTHTCSICGGSYVDSYVDALGHKTELRNAKDATCTTAGYTGDEVCTICGETLKKGTAIPATGHNLEVKNAKEPTCTESGYTGDKVCSVCGETVEKGKAIPAKGHTPEVHNARAATCTENGFTGNEICSVCGTLVKSGEIIPATGHRLELKNAKEATCTEAGYTGDKVCSVCGETVEKGKVIPAKGHTLEIRDAKAATCTEDGFTGNQICSVCGALAKSGEVIPATGHKWSDWKTTKEPTEDSEGLKEHTCSVCGEKETQTIPKADHVHHYTDVVTPPTCTEKGFTTHTCAKCGDSYDDTYVDALGHKTVIKNAKAATCTEAGYTGDEICSVCGETVKLGETISAKGHSWSDWTETKPATETAEGQKERTCSVCGAKETEKIPKLPSTFRFDDVRNENDFFYAPVYWAYYHDPQITNGTSATTFSPNATCTRGQVVTFLWRANGCPEPQSATNPFTDVKSGDYFYKAVLWANEQGITNGTSATTFSPNDPCTRAHVVTFLWRAEGKPSTGSTNPFSDVSAGQYYTDAVLWAVSKNITNGTSATTFSPGNPCTRGQIVTFLYRAKN